MSGQSGRSPDRETRERYARGEAVIADASGVTGFLNSPAFRPEPIIDADESAIVLDLSHASPLLHGSAGRIDVDWLTGRISGAMRAAGTEFAFGRYAEPRGIYDNDHFTGSDERRTVHMGVDVFCAAGTPVCTPLDGVMHVIADNARELDYGPMLVVRHDAGGDRHFYSLYGHLSRGSLERHTTGDAVAAGQAIATVGAPPGNGNWPPHLHFQLILDLLGLDAEFPGVAAASEQQFWLALSPSPAAFFPAAAARGLVYPR